MKDRPVRYRMTTEGIDAWEALRRVSSQVIFTTHTPVPAGHDCFPASLVDEHLGPLRESLGLDPHQFMGLGRVNSNDANERLLHDRAGAQVVPSRQCRLFPPWAGIAGDVEALFPDRPAERVPIGHITNGVHIQTWLAPQMRQVYDRHFGSDWPQRASDLGFWERVEAINDGELWETADGHVAAHTKSTQMSLSTGGGRADNQRKPHIHVRV